MATATTLPAFLDAFRDSLATRAGLYGVTIVTASTDVQTLGKEYIALSVPPTDVPFAYRTLPRGEISERYAIEGAVLITKPGAGEAVISAARIRAAAIFGEVLAELREKSPNRVAAQAAYGVDDVECSGWKLEQYAIDGGREARLIFTLVVQAKFTPTTS
jgi:hypothetical protein